MSTKITSNNWNTQHYYSDNLIAFISIGADLEANSTDVTIKYHVTLSNKDYEDMYQSSHEDLETAVAVLNQKYGDWQIKNLEPDNEESSGCSSCAAH